MNEQPRWQAIFLDFDGTLARMDPPHLDRYVEAAAAAGVTVTVRQLRGALDAGWAAWQTPLGVAHPEASTSAEAFDAVRRALHVARYRAAGATGNIEEAARLLADIERDPTAYALYDDALPALTAIRRAGLRSVIVSNHIWELPALCSALGLDPLIDAVITSARVGYRKPHPAIFAAALACAAGVDPARVLFVGDSPAADVAGARAAGMQALLLDRRHSAARPGVIRSLADLPLGVTA